MSEVRHLYAAVAELFCSPRDAGGRDELVRRAQEADPPAGRVLRRFMERPVSEEEYIDLFELDPLCPLYLGSHAFDEPATCARAGVSERNGYMLELLGIYRHFGFSPKGGELPDFLPMMVEFLALTSGSVDPLREKLVRDYLLPYLPSVRSRLEELAGEAAALPPGDPSRRRRRSPVAGHYLLLLEVLERALRLEFPVPPPREGAAPPPDARAGRGRSAARSSEEGRVHAG